MLMGTFISKFMDVKVLLYIMIKTMHFSPTVDKHGVGPVLGLTF